MSGVENWAKRFADYPAANLVAAIGSKYHGVGDPLQYPNFEGTEIATISDIACGKAVWLVDAIFIQGVNPGIDSFVVAKEGARDILKINNANGSKGIMDVNDGPISFEDDDWEPLRNQRDEVRFALPRKFVEEMSSNGMLHAEPIGEAIFLQTKHSKTMDEAVAAVLGPFDADRVEGGSAPQRWGLPGLRRLSAYLAAGGDPAALDRAGLSALAVAIFLEQADAVRVLVDAGADINAQAAAGLYPIDVAILSEDPAMVALCTELGASLNHSGHIQPIVRAINLPTAAPAMFESLITAGVDLSYVGRNESSVLQEIDRCSAEQRNQMLSILTTKTVGHAMDACGNGSSSPSMSQSGFGGATGQGKKATGIML